MVKISIICLIYTSTNYADWVYQNIHKYTPKLLNGEAEFIFVANDPTSRLVKHLVKKKYPHIVNINQKLTNHDLFKLGYSGPEYIHRVYRGYNEGIKKSKGEIVVLINSDMCFSKDWLENLLKHLDRNHMVCSQLVERKHKKFTVFPGAYHQEFGENPSFFKENKFTEFVNKSKKTSLRHGGAYMPCAIYKDTIKLINYFPVGNIAGQEFRITEKFGDELLVDKLKSINVYQITAMDSLVYHFKEGEKEESNHNHDRLFSKKKLIKEQNISASKYIEEFGLGRVNTDITPMKSHDYIINTLLNYQNSKRSKYQVMITYLKRISDPIYSRIHHLVIRNK